MAKRLNHPFPDGFDSLQDQYPGLRARPSREGVLTLEGEVTFRAAPTTGPVLKDTYRLQIDVPHSFPDEVLRVTEIGGRIPRSDPEAHINPDGSLCLGAPIRLVLIAKESCSVLSFFEQCAIPALYNATHRERYGGRIPLAELAHGTMGELSDYQSLFRLRSPAQVFEALRLSGMKRRDANKKPCPCGCGHRLGVCRTNERIRYVRETIGRPTCRDLTSEVKKRFMTEYRSVKK